MVEQVEFFEEAARRGDRILICGASFAGLATAWWMSELGFHVTVVEVASGLRRAAPPSTSRARRSTRSPGWG